MEEEILYNLRYTLIIAGALILYHVLFYFIKKWSQQKKRIIAALLSKYIYYPGFFIILIISGSATLAFFQKFLGTHYDTIQHLLRILLIAAGGFFIIRIVTVAREIAIHHYSQSASVDYSFRKAKTKFQLIQRIFNFLVIFATIAIILMTFSSIRQIGTTLLASAGVVGLIIGFAAQKSLGTLFGGLQIALSQPIRLDDVVIVEGQYGIIGEITLTYVVVNMWDGRRMIVPINYFLEKPFENWTRVSPEVINKVKIYADYTLPVEEIRQQVKKWLDESVLWDKRAWGLAVTSASEKTIEVRVIMSAKNAGEAFDLECQIREKLITYIQKNYPESLPVERMKIGEAVKVKQ